MSQLQRFSKIPSRFLTMKMIHLEHLSWRDRQLIYGLNLTLRNWTKWNEAAGSQFQKESIHLFQALKKKKKKSVNSKDSESILDNEQNETLVIWIKFNSSELNKSELAVTTHINSLFTLISICKKKCTESVKMYRTLRLWVSLGEKSVKNYWIIFSQCDELSEVRNIVLWLVACSSIKPQ